MRQGADPTAVATRAYADAGAAGRLCCDGPVRVGTR